MTGTTMDSAGLLQDVNTWCASSRCRVSSTRWKRTLRDARSDGKEMKSHSTI